MNSAQATAAEMPVTAPHGEEHYVGEAALTLRWAEGVRGPLRLEDGRALRVVFPGVPGGPSGPDFRGAIVDAGGDLLRGDVELHLRASGWRAHGHHLDDAYAAVVLHVVGANDTGALTTLHVSGRAVPVLVLRAGRFGSVADSLPHGFTPPCTFAVANGRDTAPVLERLGLRRLRLKAVRVAPLVRDAGAGQALYALTLESLGGPGNRDPFAALARRLPLAALLERCAGATVERSLAATAELKGAAAQLALRRAGLRPMAAPGRRLEIAGALIARWWPGGAGAAWPVTLTSDAIGRPPAVGGLGRATAIELLANAVLPVALAEGALPGAAIEAAWLGLSAPGTYGKLKRLEGWLGHSGKPFASAARLQGGLLLHADWCTKGMCGRCPLSD
jgi:Protein of unknown function (DUF2851)